MCYSLRVNGRTWELATLEDTAVDLGIVDRGEGDVLVSYGASGVSDVLVDVFGWFSSGMCVWSECSRCVVSGPMCGKWLSL